jgi:hypothetical protein
MPASAGLFLSFAVEFDKLASLAGLKKEAGKFIDL